MSWAPTWPLNAASPKLSFRQHKAVSRVSRGQERMCLVRGGGGGAPGQSQRQEGGAPWRESWKVKATLGFGREHALGYDLASSRAHTWNAAQPFPKDTNPAEAEQLQERPRPRNVL